MSAGEIIGITRAVGFNGPMHLASFLSYLYRADKGQKWDNELTPGNADFLPDGSVWQYALQSEARRAYKLEKHRAIARSAGAKSVNEIKASRFESLIVCLADDADPHSAAQDAYARASRQERWEIDAIASHLDQADGPCHIHVLGHLRAGLRRRPGESLATALYGE